MTTSFMNRNSILWLVLFIIPVFLSGQNARFYMESDRSKISEGETVVVTVVLENIKTDAVAIPDFKPFKVVSGPNKSSSFSFINGKKTSSVSYQYILMAMEKGKLKISPASAKIGSKDIYTNELTIEVSSGNTQAAFANDVKGDVSLRLEISASKAYIGQQLILDYVIYTREDIASYNFLNQVDNEGFFIQPLNNIKDRAQKKTINGKEYYTQVIARQVLFPQKTGDFTIGPINLRADIPVENGRSSFFYRETRPVTINSNTIKIQVDDLPQPQPQHYCGSVGETNIQVSLQKGTVNIGEAIVLNMQLDGSGDPKTTKAPIFNIPDGLEAYEPSLISDDSKHQSNKISVSKSYEYIFIPKEAKIYTIEPELSYFDPETKTYKTVSGGKFTVIVVESNISVSQSDTNTNKDLYEMQENYKVYNLNQQRWNYPIWLLAVFGIIMLTTIAIFYKKKKEKHLDTQVANYNKAESVAQRHLAKAAAFKNNQEFSAFYEEIASATTGYVIKKYAIPHSEASVSNIVELLKEKGIESGLISQYEWIHKQAELARFAGTYGDIDQVYNVAAQFISGMIA